MIQSSGGSVHSGSSAMFSAEDSDSDNDNDNDDSVITNLTNSSRITNVCFKVDKSKSKKKKKNDGAEHSEHSEHSYLFQCMFDQLPVEITESCSTAHTLLAFFEEFSRLVDKNGLFKKTLTLVRAWWAYETASYVGTSIKHYLSDETVTVMVAAIFNQHNDAISQPLQGLFIFLAEYVNRHT